MKKFIVLRILLVIFLILLMFNLFIYQKSDSEINILVDNSNSMKKFNTQKIKNFVSNSKYKLLTFGSRIKKNDVLKFNYGQSLIDFSKLDKNKKYILITDGHIEYKNINKDIDIIPVFLEDIKKQIDLGIENAYFPNETRLNKKRTVQLYLRNYSDTNKLFNLNIYVNDKFIKSRKGKINKNEKLPVEIPLKLETVGLNNIKIELKNLEDYKYNNQYYLYSFTKKGKTNILLAGEKGFDIYYLRKYFEKIPNINTDVYVKIHGKKFLNGEEKNKIAYSKYDYYIAVNKNILKRTPDSIISPQGKELDDVYEFNEMSNKSLYLDNLIKTNVNLSKVYFKAGDENLLGKTNETVYLNINRFYEYYIDNYEFYDFIMKKVFQILKRNKKEDIFKFRNNIYLNRKNSLISSLKKEVKLNEKKILPQKKGNKWIYDFKLNNKKNNIKVNRKTYEIYGNIYIEDRPEGQNIEKINSLTDNDFINLNYTDLKKEVNKMNKEKKYFINQWVVLLLILLIISIVWYGESKL